MPFRSDVINICDFLLTAQQKRDTVLKFGTRVVRMQLHNIHYGLLENYQL